MIPAAASTSIDVTARFFTEPLAQRLGGSTVIENKPGTGGLIAYAGVAKAAADGYTLMMAGIPMYLLPLLSQGTATFDPLAAFSPIARVARVSFGLVVNSSSPYHTLQDLIRAMRDKPNELTYSSQGVGSAAHLCGALLTHMSNTKAQHVPYKSTATATTDVAAGLVSFTMQPGPSVLGLLQTGKLRLLAVSGAQRWEAFPDVPTVAQAGIPDYELSSWLDFVAPKGTPDTVMTLLDGQLREIARTPEYKDFCSQKMIFAEEVGHQELARQMQHEARRWKEIVELI
ncbi:tripartite tricarboxylate transporter substrate binding protein [Bordetella tumbae]|uniref:tripartite tricarboxylate transporter substrate binding protein n=1 Tax=Bordetella tumbae TaxID=1649139 RepID=UPI0039F00028